MARRIGDHRSLHGSLFGAAQPPAAPATTPDAPAPGAAKPDAPRPLSVSELSKRIQGTLEQQVGPVLVLGEVSNARCVNGHWYFSIKDASARIDCMMFRSAAASCTVRAVDGAALLVRGTVTHYPPTGKTQIQVNALAHAGEGDLDARFRQLCDELRGLGYFDDAAKVPLPAVPMCIALLTSAGSAAEHDCLHAAATQFPAVRIIAVDIRVQGSGAAEAIARAIRAVDAAAPRLGIEVIVLARGGGSREDLWAFNERPLADAIRACATPLVTGVGHESDTTIADLVADLRAPTPSRAMTETLADRAALHEQVASLARRLGRAEATHLDRARQRLVACERARAVADPAAALRVQAARLAALADALRGRATARLARAKSHEQGLSLRLVRHNPQRQVEVASMRVAAGGQRLVQALQSRVQRTQAGLDSAARTLEAVGPAAVLRRGYSVTLRGDGTAVRSVADAAVGAHLQTVVADGTVHSVVQPPPGA